MRITAIVCGRKNQYSEHIARVALKSAKEAGADVALINIMDLNIRYCINCSNCSRKLREASKIKMCSLEKDNTDDMSWLDEQLLSSDGLLFVSPMFVYSPPGPYKTMCDRIGASHNPVFLREADRIRKEAGAEPLVDERWYTNRPVAFIGHGGTDTTYLSFPAIAVPLIFLELTLVDYIRLDWNADLVVDAVRMQRVERCGRHLAEMALLPPDERHYIGPKGVCPACHCDVLTIDSETREVTCSLCGVKGKLITDDGDIKFIVDKEAMLLSHMYDSGHEKHMADLKNRMRIIRAGLDQEELTRLMQPLQEEIQPIKPKK